MNDYITYIIDQAQYLLSIDSPTGYTGKAADYLISTLQSMGFSARKTLKGGVIADLGKNASETSDNALLLAAHCDTLGGMVRQITSSGHLLVTPIGGMRAENAEAENCRIFTRSGSCYEGTCQLQNASVHVNDDYDVKRTWENMEILIDEPVYTKEEVMNLGIRNGDYICFDPRTRVTGSGYIKSRFLDDKISSAILLGYAKYLSDSQAAPSRHIYLHFTVFEEVGHGASASFPADVTEMLAVDMGCVGDGLECTEQNVSICAKDSGGPYNYDMVSRLVQTAEANGISYAVDVYPHYGSDTGTALRAGNDFRHALIGPGVYASHGYERTHTDGVRNTFELIRHFIG